MDGKLKLSVHELSIIMGACFFAGIGIGAAALVSLLTPKFPSAWLGVVAFIAFVVGSIFCGLYVLKTVIDRKKPNVGLIQENSIGN